MNKFIIVVLLFIIVVGAYVYSNPGVLSELQQTLESNKGGGGGFTPPISFNDSNVTFNTTNSKNLNVMFFNIQIFGVSKASNPDVMGELVDTMSVADIIFVQEIRDASGEAFVSLCDMMPGYKCNISERLGRTSSKEQYGIIYRAGTLFEITQNTDYDTWERPPSAFKMRYNTTNLTFIVLHSKPTDAEAEIDALDDYANTFEGAVIVGGDMNMDCSYYTETGSEDFSNWEWVIPNYEDTTVSSTDCTYDRIFLNSVSDDYYDGYWIDKSISEEASDHYPVMLKLESL